MLVWGHSWEQVCAWATFKELAFVRAQQPRCGLLSHLSWEGLVACQHAELGFSLHGSRAAHRDRTKHICKRPCTIGQS